MNSHSISKHPTDNAVMPWMAEECACSHSNSTPTSRVDIRIIEDSESFAGCRDAWDNLTNEPMESHAWFQSWWNAFGDPNRLHIIEFRRDQQTIGFAPLYCDKWFALRRVRFLASGNTCTDYIDLVCHPSDYEACSEALAKHLEQAHFDLIELECPRKDRLAEFLSRRLVDLYRYEDRSEEPTWVLELPATWEEFKSGSKKSLRRKIKKAEKRWASGEFQLVSTKEQLALSEAFEILKSLHIQRWTRQGTLGVFTDPRFEKFLKSALEQLSIDQRAEIVVMMQDHEPIGAQVYMDTQDGFRLYQSGYATEAMKLEPGHLMFTAMVQRAIERRDTSFDFLRGNEAYKSYWGAKPKSQKKTRLVSKRFVPSVIARTVATARQWIRRQPESSTS